MADYPSILVQLHHNLQILREREARYAGQAPLELVNQIEDHRQAIELAGRWERGELSEADWRATIAPLLINIRQRRGEAAVSINIGDISGGVHGSIIAGGDVNSANLLNTGDISGSYNVIGHGAQLVIRQIEHLSPAELARRDEDVYARQLAQAVKARVAGFQRLVEKSTEVRPNPYKSLNYYGLEDAPFFTGREQAVSDLLGQIHQHRLTVLFADSGAGKSSLLQAGIAARLLAAGHLPVVIRLHGREPVSLTVRKNIVPELGAVPADEPLPVFLGKINRLLGQSNLYLFLDQFETFFLNLPPLHRETFVAELNECLDLGDLDVRWVLSLRGEYLYRLHSFGPRARTNEFYLPPFSVAEARQVILQPARSRQTGYQAGLADQILADLSAETAGTETDGFAPPQVQLVCHTLFEQVKNQPPPRTITEENYARLGRAGGILTRHLGRTIEQLPTRLEQDIARQVLEALVAVSLDRQQVRDTRLGHSLTSEVQKRVAGAGDDTIAAVIRFLVDNYLLRVDHDISGDDRYELTHDVLLAEIELDPVTRRRKLAEQMLWQEVQTFLGSHRKTRISADKLALIEPDLANMVLDDDARELLSLSRGAVKRRRRLVMGSAGVVTVLVALALVSVLVMLNARRSLADLNRQAGSINTALRSLQWGTRDAEKALLFAIQAAQIAETGQAHSALWQSLRYPLRAVLEPETKPFAPAKLVIGPTGQYAAAGSRNGTITVWNIDSRQRIQTIQMAGNQLVNLEFHPSGNLLLAADGETAQIWPVGGSVPTLTLPNADFATFSPTGRLVQVDDAANSAVRLVRTATGTEHLSLAGGNPWSADVFSPDERYLLVGEEDDDDSFSFTARILDAAGGRELFRQTRVTEARFSPTGRYLLVRTETDDGRDNVQVLETANGAVHLNLGNAEVSFVANSDDRYLVVTQYGEEFEPPKLYNLPEGEIKFTLGQSPVTVTGAVLSPAGKYLAGKISGNDVRIWQIKDGLGRAVTLTDPADTVDYSIDRIRFSPDEQYVMTLGHTWVRRRNISQAVQFIHDARIWEIDSAQSLFVSGGNAGAAVTSDGMWLATLKQDGVVWLHTAHVLPEDYRVEVGAKILAAGFGPAGKTVWVRNEAGLQSRGITTGARLDSAPPETTTRPDGRYSVITGNQVRIIDTATGVEKLTFSDGTLVEFGPANRTLAVAEPGNISVRLISLAGDEPVTLEGHTGRVNAMSFSPDGSLLITAGEDGTARLWLTATGETIAILPGAVRGVTGVAFSADARQVLAFGPDGIIRIWANPTIPEMIETATKRIRPSWQSGRIEK